MRYYNIQQPDETVSMRDTVTACMSRCCGLYMPVALPKVPRAFINNLPDMSLREIAYVTTDIFMGEDIGSAAIKRIVDDAIAFDVPVKALSGRRYVAELFHGPTGVFKDIGARFMAGLFDELLVNDGRKLNILVSTNGNTGVAVADAFAGHEHVNVFILYPRGSVTREMSERMISSHGNIHPIEVAGSIDDCKAMVADTFGDESLRDEIMISSANSTNFARLMPQVALYFYAAGRVGAIEGMSRPLSFSVPSGNLGMLVSGLMAKRIGLNVRSLIGACNANNALTRYLQTGESDGRPTVRTYARLMDMSKPSNLPRLRALCNDDMDCMRREIVSATASDELISDTVKRVFSEDAYIADPHTAVGIAGLDMQPDRREPGVVFATAAPAKSRALLYEFLGDKAALPAADMPLHGKKAKPDRLPPTYPALRKYIRSHQ